MSARSIFPSDMIRQQFGRWTVLAEAATRDGSGAIRWQCQCSCPAQTIRAIPTYTLLRGTSRSCGCLRDEVARNSTRLRKTVHGHTAGGKATKEFIAWQHMLGRCYTLSNNRYYCYGARGVTVHEPWKHSFLTFLADVGYSPSSKHSLGRINNDLPYRPGNVEWQTAQEQMRNTSRNRYLEYESMTYTLAELARKFHIRALALSDRLAAGMTLDEAITTPIRSTKYEFTNVITWHGKTQSLSEWARELGIKYTTLWQRIVKGQWDIEKAFLTPIGKPRRTTKR